MTLDYFVDGNVLYAEDLVNVFAQLFNPTYSEHANNAQSATTSVDWVLVHTVTLTSDKFVYGFIDVTAVGGYQNGVGYLDSAFRISVDDVSKAETAVYTNNPIFPLLVCRAEVSTGASHTIKFYIKKDTASSIAGNVNYTIRSY